MHRSHSRPPAIPKSERQQANRESCRQRTLDFPWLTLLIAVIAWGFIGWTIWQDHQSREYAAELSRLNHGQTQTAGISEGEDQLP